MIPFDLEKALAAKKEGEINFKVTGLSRKIIDWYYFRNPPIPQPNRAICVQFQDWQVIWYEIHELEMLPKEKVMWLNVYQNPHDKKYTCGCLHETREIASRFSNDEPKHYHSTIPVTITENK